jgi:hypothetical protein
MKNLFKVLGIIALVAIIGLSFAACDDNSGGGGSGGPGGPGNTGGSGGLVAKWYVTQGMADAGDSPVWEFTSNGKLTSGGVDVGLTYKATSNTITLYYGSTPLDVPTHYYTISGTVLTITNPESPLSDLVGTWYKPRR